MPLFLDELQRAQAETAVLVGFAEEPDGLALGAETADGLVVGYVEDDTGIRGRKWRVSSWWGTTTLWEWRGSRKGGAG